MVGRALSWGFMVINIGCRVGGKSEILHTSCCKKNEKKKKTQTKANPHCDVQGPPLPVSLTLLKPYRPPSLFLKYSRPSPISGPLHWLLPLPGMLPSLTTFS